MSMETIDFEHRGNIFFLFATYSVIFGYILYTVGTDQGPDEPSAHPNLKVVPSFLVQKYDSTHSTIGQKI